MKITNDDFQAFYELINPIIQTPSFQKMKEYIQHGHTSCYEHTIMVALRCYLYAKKHPKLDLNSLIRGALLHDYFLYDWHDPNKGFRWHGYKHPKIAYQKANDEYNLNDKEKGIIINHMFPLTLLHFPKTREAWIVCYYDKICSMKETLKIKYEVKVI